MKKIAYLITITLYGMLSMLLGVMSMKTAMQHETGYNPIGLGIVPFLVLFTGIILSILHPKEEPKA